MKGELHKEEKRVMDEGGLEINAGELKAYIMTLVYLITGFIVGMGLLAQTGINGRLRRSLGSPFLTSFVSFVISTIFIIIWGVDTNAIFVGVDGFIR